MPFEGSIASMIFAAMREYRGKRLSARQIRYIAQNRFDTKISQPSINYSLALMATDGQIYHEGERIYSLPSDSELSEAEQCAKSASFSKGCVCGMPCAICGYGMHDACHRPCMDEPEGSPAWDHEYVEGVSADMEKRKVWKHHSGMSHLGWDKKQPATTD